MDMTKYGSAFIKPDDVRDGPRQDRIINVYISEKYNCPVLDLESGDQFSLNQTNTRIMNKAYGTESDGWLGPVVEFFLGTYKSGDETKDTVVLKPISLRDPAAGNGSETPTRTIPSKPRDMDDEIPF
jgi:hypothetical protein